jgi:uncharacterized iron-regulated protein
MKTVLMIVTIFSALIPAMAQTTPHSSSTYLPQRVFDANDKRYSDFESMLADLARHDVVFVGEQHNDPATHRLERAILEGIARRRSDIVVAMEMFERDVQPTINDYLAGRSTEEEFLQSSRPWPGYMTDYRPLVELARLRNWRVIASNTPRRIASEYSKKGLDLTSSLAESDRKLVAAEIKCPFDDYYKLFSEVMGKGHPAHGMPKDSAKGSSDERNPMIERFYYAQCVKDETMAESIARQFTELSDGKPRPLVVHFNGAFHSDFRLGAAARAIRRMPQSKVKVVTVVPVEDLDKLDLEEYQARGDYVIFSLKPPTVRSAELR